MQYRSCAVTVQTSVLSLRGAPATKQSRTSQLTIYDGFYLLGFWIASLRSQRRLSVNCNPVRRNKKTILKIIKPRATTDRLITPEVYPSQPRRAWVSGRKRPTIGAENGMPQSPPPSVIFSSSHGIKIQTAAFLRLRAATNAPKLMQ